MTPPYLFILFTALLLTRDTRKRPPQSGSVQTGFEEPWAGSAFDGSKLPRRRLMARVNGSPSEHIQSRSDGARSPTVRRLRAVVGITYYLAIYHYLSGLLGRVFRVADHARTGSVSCLLCLLSRNAAFSLAPRAP